MSVSRSAEPAARAPFVVIVDDEDQSDFAESLRDQDVGAVAVEPDDLGHELLGRASLVLVDQYLDRWPGRDQANLPATLRVPDGLSLAAVLRSSVEGSGLRGGPPSSAVAIALRTGELDTIGAGLPVAARQYLLAGQYNLEWVFNKAEAPSATWPSASRRVAALARAAAVLPSNWGPGTEDPGLRWLRVPRTEWSEDAAWQVEQCRPPQHVLAERTAGRAWLRWFMQRILPFPTFLLDRDHLALRLGITKRSLESVLSSDSPLAEQLALIRYQGGLDTFMGDRWWRAGAASLLDDQSGTADESDPSTIADALSVLHGADLEPLLITDPVIGIDAEYAMLPDPLSAASSVRLQPDDWPPYADDPWASKDAVEGEESDPALRALVVSTDRWRLGEHGKVDGTG